MNDFIWKKEEKKKRKKYAVQCLKEEERKKDTRRNDVGSLLVVSVSCVMIIAPGCAHTDNTLRRLELASPTDQGRSYP